MSTFLDPLQLGDDDDLFPNDHYWNKYHDYDVTDGDIEIEFWDFDQPGEPLPEAVWWAVMDLLDEMD